MDSAGSSLVISVLVGLASAIIGSLFTYHLNYAKTKAMMKWEMKFNAYNAILELDKGRPGTLLDKNQEIRFAMRLKALSQDEKIKDIADTMIKCEFENLKAKQRFIDEKFIPAIEKDLEDTMKLFRWK